MNAKNSVLLKNAECFIQNNFNKLDIYIKNNLIHKIDTNINIQTENTYDCTGLTIFPGFIDTQVHFREPGNPEKETLESGSKSAVLGGITSVFEMPNTSPPTDTKENFQDKLNRAKDRMFCNYAFYFGATEKNSENLEFVNNLEACCGIKMFVGSSTGNLLIKNDKYIEQVIKNSPKVVAIHSEDENMLVDRKKFIKKGDVCSHYEWRNIDCALNSSKKLISYAKKYKKKIHILHISTKEEIEYARNNKEYFTLEATPQHLTLHAPECYERLNTLAQMNPPIRTKDHLEGIWKGVQDNIIDIIGSDHAPHTLEQKKNEYPKSPSGMPGVQTIGLIMSDYALQKKISFQRLVDLLCKNPCKIFGIKNRGEIMEGNFADLTIYKMNKPYVIKNNWIASNSGWTAFDGMKVNISPFGTVINGNVAVWDNMLNDKTKFGKPLVFN